MTDDDKECGDGSAQVCAGMDDFPVYGAEVSTPDANSVPMIDFQLPAGFTQSLTGIDVAIARWLAPIRAQMNVVLPEFSEYVRDVLGPPNRRLQEQMSQVALIMASLPTFAPPPLGLPEFKDVYVIPAIEAELKRIADRQSAILADLRESLKPQILDANRKLLPSNLKSCSDEIRADQVLSFLEQEGIPLYLVPRGRTALRLLRAEGRSARRKVLGDCYNSIIDDCATVLNRANCAVVKDELGFALDGLGAMRAGHYRSAQAMFTVTLDTLIYRFFPGRDERRSITSHKKGADVPDAIDEMGVHEAMVWLAIWNAHEEFWKHKGDRVPHYYSRHASVHGVSSRQFSKRNCIQVLMLVTSLIGYACREARGTG